VKNEKSEKSENREHREERERERDIKTKERKTASF